MPNSEAAKRPTCALCGAEIPPGEAETNENIVDLATKRPATVCKQWYDYQDRKSKTVYEGCRTRTRRARKQVWIDSMEDRLMALPPGPARDDYERHIEEFREQSA